MTLHTTNEVGYALTNVCIHTKIRRYIDTIVTFMQYARLQTGGCGENAAEVAFTSVHVVVAAPTNSKPELQL